MTGFAWTSAARTRSSTAPAESVLCSMSRHTAAKGVAPSASTTTGEVAITFVANSGSRASPPRRL
ncbi:hypothetical protein ACWEOE_38885 [Amycolatopsis sp. NPDC004368]